MPETAASAEQDHRRRAALALALKGQTASPKTVFIFDALGGVALALLGHWGWGLHAFLGLTLFDIGLQRWCRLRMARIEDEPPSRALRTFGLLLGLRHTLLLSGSVGALILRPGPSEAAYLAITAATVLMLAVVQGSSSSGMLRAGVLPGVAAMLLAAGVLALEPGGGGLVLACLILVALVGAVAATTLAVRSQLSMRDAEKAVLIEDLSRARDEAVADRIAAEAAREEARRADAAKSVFLATMSHEIRTPMNGVLGMAQVLKRTPLQPDQADQLETLIQSGEMLLALLNDILDWSKIDAGRMELSPVATDLPALLGHAAAFWKPRATDKGLELTLEIAPDLPRFVSVDPLRLRQILFNLLGNAIKFTPSGRVSLIARAEPAGAEAGGGARLVLAVKDTGVGVSEDALDRIFERFGQAGADTARSYGGTGLGLAIAKRLAGLMGGALRVETALGAGSTFTVDTPLVTAEAPVEEARADADEEAGRPLRVLTIDDNAVNLKVVELLLGQAGHEVTCAASAAEGLQAADAEPFDVIFTDMHMPPATGVDVLTALRDGRGPNRTTPVYVVTADAMDEDRRRFLDLGFSGHIPKPLELPTLFAVVAGVAAGIGAAPDLEQGGEIATA